MNNSPHHANPLKRWWCWHVPGTYRDRHLCFDESTWLQGLYYNWWRFVRWMPLLTLLRPSWWREALIEDRKNRFKTCGCGRTWFKYRLLPALIGDKRLGGGC